MVILCEKTKENSAVALFLFVGIGYHLVDKSKTASFLCFHSDNIEMICFCCQFHLTSIVHILFTGTTLCSTVFQQQNTFVISLGVLIFFIHKHVSH